MNTEISGCELPSYPHPTSAWRSHQLAHKLAEFKGSFQLASMSGQILKLDYDAMSSVGWVVDKVPVDGKKVLGHRPFTFGPWSNIFAEDVKDGAIEIKLFFRERPLEHEYTKLFDVFDDDAEKVISWVRVNAPRLGQDIS